MQKTGNADGKHRIIVLSGAGPCYRFFMKDFAGQFEADNEVIFLSRPGYDGSDDTKEAMTVERVVESYRTAEEVQAYFDESGYKEELIAYYSEDFTGNEAEREGYACQKYLAEIEKNRTNELEPFVEKLGNCEIRYLPGSHFLYEEKPEECAAIVQDFLNGLDG